MINNAGYLLLDSVPYQLVQAGFGESSTAISWKFPSSQNLRAGEKHLKNQHEFVGILMLSIV